MQEHQLISKSLIWEKKTNWVVLSFLKILIASYLGSSMTLVSKATTNS